MNFYHDASLTARLDDLVSLYKPQESYDLMT